MFKQKKVKSHLVRLGTVTIGHLSQRASMKKMMKTEFISSHSSMMAILYQV